MAAISTTTITTAPQGLHLKLLPPISSSGDPLTTSSVSSAAIQPRLDLKLEAHRRWNTSLPVGFLVSIDRIEINSVRVVEGDNLVYVVEIYMSLPASRLPTNKSTVSKKRTVAEQPTFTVERSFSAFEELRKRVSSCVSMERQCTCKYCMSFVEYIRFEWNQPRGLAKLLAGQEKRKQILTSFLNDFVVMGQRRVQKTGKRKCEAQQLVPKVLNEFLGANR